MSDLCRRTFLVTSASLCCAAAARPSALVPPIPTSSPDPTFPHQPPALVRAVVGASHRDLDKVKELVEAHPPLARAAWDWGFGDWETALGAASHVGRRNIAEYLISKGARPDIFTFAMFGDLNTVKAMIEAQPDLFRLPGPHGITLVQHARNAGSAAEPVVAFLESLGDPAPAVPDQALSDRDIQAYTGTYSFDDQTTFDIKEVRGRLSFQRGEETRIVLTRRAPDEFSPAGAQEVRLVFERVDGRSVSITVRNHGPQRKAVRTS